MIISLLIVLSISVSCVNKCHEVPSKAIVIDFDFPGITNSKSAKYFDNDSLTAGKVILNEKDFNNILNGIKLSEVINHLYMVILYLDIDLSETSVIKPENIIGFSSYAVEESIMYHKLFIKKHSSDTYNPVNKFSCTVNAIRSNDPHEIALRLSKFNHKHVTLLSVFYDSSKLTTIRSRHELTGILSQSEGLSN